MVTTERWVRKRPHSQETQSLAKKRERQTARTSKREDSLLPCKVERASQKKVTSRKILS